MSEHDEKLKERLRTWRGIEPRSDFEAEVWRRLATASAESFDWFEALRAWFGVRPALAGVAALLLAIAVGFGSTAALAPSQQRSLSMQTPTLQGQTLAGTYLAMTAGGIR